MKSFGQATDGAGLTSHPPVHGGLASRIALGGGNIGQGLDQRMWFHDQGAGL